MSYLRNYKLISRARNPDLFDRNGIYREPKYPPQSTSSSDPNKKSSLLELLPVDNSGRGTTESCFTQLGGGQRGQQPQETQAYSKEDSESGDEFY